MVNRRYEGLAMQRKNGLIIQGTGEEELLILTNPFSPRLIEPG